jgi:hypothetical protein
MIYDLSPDLAREPDCLVTPPNSSIMFAQCAAIPQLKGELYREHWLACAVQAMPTDSPLTPELPVFQRENNQLVVTPARWNKSITIVF